MLANAQTRALTALTWLRRAAHVTPSRLAFFAVSALWLLWPLFTKAAALNEFRDGQVMFNYEDVAVRTVREFGQWPLWNPYYCGGLYALGTPQSRFASPPFLLSLLFGALRSAPLVALAMSVLGMEGFYRYARTRTASALGPALIAPLFAANGFMAFSYFSGWLNFYGFLLLPWVLFSLDALLRDRRHGVLLFACSFAFIVGFGGTYAGPLAALLALAHLARTLYERPTRLRDKRVLGRLLLALYVTLLVSALRLWPVIESMIAAPRLMAGTPGESLSSLFARMSRLSNPVDGNYGRNGQQYVGSAVVVLCALGVFRKRSVVVLPIAVLCLWVASGYHYAPSAFAWLRDLPVLSVLRYPERFLFLVMLLGFEVAAFGVDAWVRSARRFPRLALPMLALSLLLMAVGLRQEVHNQHVSAAGMWLAPAPLEITRPFKQARGNRWQIAHYASISRGSIACWEAYPVPMSAALRGDLPQEEYLADASAGQVTRKSWSPNQLELEVETTRPTMLVVNQNYHPGWRSSLGRPEPHDDLLALALPAGRRTVTLTFLPRSALFGGLLSAAGLLAGVALLYRKRRLALAALLAAPLLLLSAFTLYDEPLPHAPLQRNADGTPLLVDKLPSQATPLQVRWALPMTLDGVWVDGAPRADGTARIELFWRVLGDLPKDLGISVHFESDRGRLISADHDTIGASTLPRRAPRDQLLRDVSAVVLDGAPGEHWRIFVCLWHMHGDQSRVPLTGSGGRPVDVQRVLVGEI